ncbi:MAG: hypothetical protein LC104_00660 [Bacteroidales bacterium]|nr:hypothetical protein [Bacteroidales bacterium]
MLSPITLRYPFPPCRRSLAADRVADLFGLAPTEPPHTIAENLTLDVRPGDLVLFTGPSGSGKSSLMREVGQQLGAIDILQQPLPELPLIEAMAGPLESRLADLAACGLSEARLLLRTPQELSDGQRYRFRIAYALAQATAPTHGDASPPAPNPPLMLDEFAAVLDRPLAKVLAFNLRKLATRTGIGVLAATTHDDLEADLNPDLLVRCLGEGQFAVDRRDVKKNGSASRSISGSRRAPVPTGRTSHGGIIAAITSPSFAG